MHKQTHTSIQLKDFEKEDLESSWFHLFIGRYGFNKSWVLLLF